MFNSSLPLLSLTLLTGCKYSPATQHTLSEKDANHTVAAKVGDEVVVRLVSNPTTGYGWLVGRTDAKILPVQGKTEFARPESPVPGSPSVQIWRFKAIKTGKVKLELHYRRSWEKQPPQEIWRATVDVR